MKKYPCNLLWLYVVPLLMAGCAEYPVATLNTRPVTRQQPVTLISKQQTVDPNCLVTCYAEYNATLTECNVFFDYEPNKILKDKQNIKCLKKRGFPNGMESCKNRC